MKQQILYFKETPKPKLYWKSIYLAFQLHSSVWNLFSVGFFPFQEFAPAWKQVSKQHLSILKEKWLGTPQCHCIWQVSAMYLPSSFSMLQTLRTQKVPQMRFFFFLIHPDLKKMHFIYGLIEKICFCLLEVAVCIN